MKYSVKNLSSVAVLTAMTPLTSGFVASPALCREPIHPQLPMTSYSEDERSYYRAADDEKEGKERDPNMLPTQYGKKMSESIPFLECPRVLQTSELAGNVGFDPLHFAKNREQLWEYREAEIKHARLAMIASIGWPVSELLDRDIADFFQAPALLEDGDRAPTILNGGMDKVSPQFWGFCVGLCAAIDMYGVAKSRRGDPGYFPGNLGFDPFNFFPDDKLTQERLKLAEIKHGRTAMLGVLGYVVEEYTTKMAVIDDTPILFQPITETVEEAIIGAMAAEEALGDAMIGSF